MLSALLDQFIEWHQSAKGDLENVANSLAEPLPSNAHELLEVLAQTEAYYARIGYLLNQANSFLEKFQYCYLTSKEGSTETERKVKLGFDTADYRLVRNNIEVLLDSLKQRIILGESIIRFESQFAIKPIMEKPF